MERAQMNYLIAPVRWLVRLWRAAVYHAPPSRLARCSPGCEAILHPTRTYAQWRRDRRRRSPA